MRDRTAGRNSTHARKWLSAVLAQSQDNEVKKAVAVDVQGIGPQNGL